MYLKSLEKMVTYCLDKMGPSLFQYVGTAATARDLAAMADVFDGPGSQINLWTQAHGSVVVSNLMKLFPERVGKVVMDDPVDPIAFTETASHLRWIADVGSANNSLAVFEKAVVTGTTRGFTVLTGHLDYDLHTFKERAMAMRGELIGWQNGYDVEHARVVQEDVSSNRLSNIEIFMNLSSTREGNMLNTHRFGQDLGLGGVPLVCGDAAYDHDTENKTPYEDVATILIDNLDSAQIMTSRAFPPWRYLCHLWPIRAVERVSLRPPFQANLDLSKKVLVLLHEKDYWTYFSVAESDARQIWPGANVFGDMPYGDHAWNHDQCSADMIKGFFREGTVPDSALPCARGHELDFVDTVFEQYLL
ncbi:hypothetical protein C8Q74DRAFT_253767 [Fomes fomentarius]|nr:hypothetical protein C8Q74DRAFT_253767 [Fomes fomentarius]